MKQIIFIFLLSLTFVNAQEKVEAYDYEYDEDGRKLSKVEFNKAVVLHNKMVNSDDFIEKKKSFDKLFLIVNKNSHPQSFLYEGDKDINNQKIQDWADKNVPPENKNEAIKLLSRIVFLDNKINTENTEIIEILKYKASWSQCQKIMNPNLRD